MPRGPEFAKRKPVTYHRNFEVVFHVSFESTVKAIESSGERYHDDSERLFPNIWSIEETCTMGDGSWVRFSQGDGVEFDPVELQTVTRKLQLLDDAFAAMTEGTKAEGT